MYICEPGCMARIKQVKTAYVLVYLGILPNNQGEALVSERPLQQLSTAAGFVRPVCSRVVL